MKGFKEYITEKEEIEFQERLDEDLVTVAGAILGYTAAGALIAWGASVVVKGYVSLMSKAINGIIKGWKGIFGNRPKTNEVIKTVKDMKQDQTVKVMSQKSKTERSKFEEELGPVFEAINNKEADKAASLFKESKVKATPVVYRVIIGEITKALGEPPIHYGNTGNEAYLFVKKILGIKVAQAAATVVKEALKKQGSELIKNIDEQ